MASSAKIRANNKYNAKTYTQLSVRIKPELANSFRAKCEENGKSVRAVLIDFMENYIEKF